MIRWLRRLNDSLQHEARMERVTTELHAHILRLEEDYALLTGELAQLHTRIDEMTSETRSQEEAEERLRDYREQRERMAARNREMTVA